MLKKKIEIRVALLLELPQASGKVRRKGKKTPPHHGLPASGRRAGPARVPPSKTCPERA